MALPTYGSFSLQDSNYITTNIEYRTWPARDITTSKLARRPGSKFIAEEFGEKRIKFEGYILGASASDLQSKIDDLYTTLQKKSQILQIASGRYIIASVASIAVSDPGYAQDMVPFSLEFVAPDPFFYGTALSASITVTSGTIIQSLTTTISGSYFAEPSVVYTPPSATGDTTTSGIKIVHNQSGEYIDWTGTGSGDVYLDYGSSMTFDYQTYKVLQGTTSANFTGTFSHWEPGTNSITITFGGNTEGGTVQVSYTPRYL